MHEAGEQRRTGFYKSREDILTLKRDLFKLTEVYSPNPSKVELTGNKNEIGHRNLSIDNAKTMLSINPATGKPEKKNKFGTHIVTQIENVHYKVGPEGLDPSAEFEHDSLNRIISGQGSTPSMLFKIIYNGVPYCIQASKSVDGINLEDIIREQPALLNKIDPYNFSSLVVWGLVTNPYDASAPQFIAQKGQGDLLELVGVDNALGFTEPFGVMGKDTEQHIITVKDVIKFLPSMKDPINPKFRDNFLSSLPEIMLIDWLVSLHQQDLQYQDLISQQVFTAEELKEMNLPMKIHENLLQQMYDALHAIQRALRLNPNMTHKSLVETIQPELSKCYDIILHRKKGNIADAILALYFDAPTAEELLTSEPVMLANIKKKYNKDRYFFIDKRTQTISEAIEVFVNQVINYQNIPVDRQKIFLNDLLDLPAKEFSFRNCEALNNDYLNRLGRRSDLQKVHISNCNNVTVDGLKALILQRPNVEIVLGFNKNIDLKIWAGLVADTERFAIQVESAYYPIKPKAPSSVFLFRFIEEATPALLQFVADRGVNLQCLDQVTGQTLLHKAVLSNRVEVVRYLVNERRISVHAHDFEKNLPLHFAFQLGHIEITKILLAAKSILLARNKQGETPLHKAVEFNQLALVRTIISTYPDLKEDLLIAQNMQGQTVFHYAARLPTSDMTEFLLTQKDQVNSGDKNGQTPLHLAAIAGSAACVLFLLKNKACVDSCNNSDKKPLDVATIPETVGLLQLYTNVIPILPVLGEGLHVVKGISVSIKLEAQVKETPTVPDATNEKQVREFLSSLWMSYPNKETWILIALKEIKGSKEPKLIARALKAVIGNYAKDPKTLLHLLISLKNHYSLVTPLNKLIEKRVLDALLHLALQQEPIVDQVIEELLRSGADVNALDELNRPVLRVAISRYPIASVSTIRMLLGQAAIDVNMKDENNLFPIFRVADWAHRAREDAKKLFKSLLVRGADIEQQDTQKKETVLEKMVQRNKREIVEDLIELGANAESEIVRAYLAKPRTDSTPTLLGNSSRGSGSGRSDSPTPKQPPGGSGLVIGIGRKK